MKSAALNPRQKLLANHPWCGAIYHCAAIFTFLFQKPEEAGQHEEVQVLLVSYFGVERWQGSFNLNNYPPNPPNMANYPQTYPGQIVGTLQPTCRSFWTKQISRKVPPNPLPHLPLDSWFQASALSDTRPASVKASCNPIILSVSKFNLKMGQESTSSQL